VLVVSDDDTRTDALLSVALPLVSLPDRTLIVAQLVADEDDVTAASAALGARRESVDVPLRTAAFTSLEPARDVVRLATNYEVELVLLDAPAELDGEHLPADLAAIAERSPADVAIVCGPAPDWRAGAGVFVPFGGGESDWAALALGAWLATGTKASLRLVGTRADPTRGQRDASRLLADASLATQRVVGVAAEPLLVDATADALLAAVAEASVVVSGLPTRWRVEGLGTTRRALVRAGRPPVLVVHRGARPGGLAPRESLTRFSWSLEP
jgi:hypothetical protein